LRFLDIRADVTGATIPRLAGSVLAMKRFVMLVVLAAMVLAAAPAADAATPRAPKLFHGVMWDRAAMGGTPEEDDAQWALMRSSGVETARLVFSWAHAQPTPDTLDFSAIDAKVELATRHNVRVLPVVLYTPDWARKFPERQGSPPESPANYAAFMGRLVERYGPNGDFWFEHPELPQRPVREWQIWNEPHLDFYWFVPQSDPEDAWVNQYVDLLGQARRAIKNADPGATVVLAGLADASWRVLAKLYRNGARRKFDVAAINIFTGRPGFVMTAVRLTRRVLRRFHERRKPIWVTETTFPAAKGEVPVPEADWQRRWYTTDSGMASRLTELYRLGRVNARRLGLRRIYWYTWGTSYSGREDLFDYSGLVRIADGQATPRPALRAFRRAARH
jgi:Beta-galactosidase